MAKIKLLEKQLSELIAAGEVVDRPSSVVKELLENAIDSGATSITVEIKNGGKTYIRVTDNGCGFDHEDLPVAFMRHATSKISTQSDLDRIGTLGFRGEALASIAAVSNVQILTMAEGAQIGSRIEYAGSEQIYYGEAGSPKGTTVVVKDLFYNTPARMKFMKSDRTEAAYIQSICEKIFVSMPQIAFKFIKDSVTVIQTPGDNKLSSAIYAVFGKNFNDGLVKLQHKNDKMKVYGYISKPELSRANRNMQLFFVNGRYIRSKVLYAALEEAYKGSILTGKFPSCVIFVDIPLDFVDVNVHPAKTEIRVWDEKSLFDAVYHGVKGTISNLFVVEESKPEIAFSYNPDYVKMAQKQAFAPIEAEEQISIISSHNMVDEVKAPDAAAVNNNELNDDEIKELVLEKQRAMDVLWNETQSAESMRFAEPIQPIETADYGEQTDNKADESDSETMESFRALLNEFKSDEAFAGAQKEETPHSVEDEIKSTQEEIKVPKSDAIHPQIKYVGEFFNTYMAVEYLDEIIFIDKHAAHERMIFEKLLEESSQENRQVLLTPITVELSAVEYAEMLDKLEELEKIGFLAEGYGNNLVLIREAPLYLSSDNVKTAFLEIVELILKNSNRHISEIYENLLHSIACRSAIKANDVNSFEELKDFSARVIYSNTRYCPHGRPVLYRLTKKELEKKFLRT